MILSIAMPVIPISSAAVYLNYFDLFSVSCRTLRPNMTDAADAVATQDNGARELNASKHDRINAIIAIAANTYCIIR